MFPPMKKTKKRYVQVGIGGRSVMYTEAILKHFPKEAELVGLCDVNAGRMELRNRLVTE